MKKNQLILILPILLILTILVLIITKGSPESKSKTTDKPKVTASFYPLYYFTSQIAGEMADVVNITPQGAEPHDFEPTAKDLTNIASSQVLVLNGKLEPWGDKIKNNFKEAGITIVSTGENLTDKDPHTWLAPNLAKAEVDRIARALEKVDPVNSSAYANNAANLKNRLEVLDQEYKTGLANCQKEDFVTSHAAFGTLAKEYGLNQVAIAGLSPDEEPSPKKLAEVTKFVTDNNIKYIFFESLASPKLSRTKAGETGAQTLVLNPIEGLNSNEIQQGKDYFSEMRVNLKNLQTALQCQT